MAAQCDIDGSSRQRGDDTGDFPSAERRFQDAILATLKQRNLIDEVGEEDIPAVVSGSAEVILPTQIGIGNWTEISSGAAARSTYGIIAVGIGVPELVGQVVVQQRAAHRRLKRIVVAVRLVSRHLNAVVSEVRNN